MATAGSIVVDLLMRTGSFETDAQRASKTAEKRFKEIQKQADETAKAVGDSFRNLLSGAILGIGVKEVFGKFIEETKNAQNEQAQLAAVLKSTGNAAGFTAAELNKMASGMAGFVSEGDINRAQTRLLSYTGVVGEEFPRALQAAIDMSVRLGMTVEQSAETIGKALDVPSKGLTALSKQGFRFTEDQKKLVESLEATGRVAEAQDVVLKALESSYGGAADAARNTLGGALQALQNQINDLMTGDDDSVNGLTASINDLTDTLGSSEAKQAFADFVGFLADVSRALVTAAADFAEGMRAADGFMDAVVTYGLMNPFNSHAENAEKYRKQLEELNAFEQRVLSGTEQNQGIDIAAQRRQLLNRIAFSERKANAQERDVLSAYIGVDETGASVPTLSPIRASESAPSEKSTKERVDQGQKLIDQMNQRIALIGKETEYEKLLEQVRIGSVTFKTEAQKNEALASAQTLDFINEQTKAYEDSQKQAQALAKVLDDLYPDQAKQNDYLSSLALLTDGMANGALSAEEYSAAVAKLEEKFGDASGGMTEFAVQAAHNIQDALGDTLYDVLSGRFDDIGSKFADTIFKMAANAAAANLAGALFGDFGKGGQIGGLLGGAFSSLLGGAGAAPTAAQVGAAGDGLMFFADGGYTGSGGKYDPAGIVHAGEYVIPADATRRLGVGFLDRLKGYAQGGYVGATGIPPAAGGATRVEIINNGTPQQVTGANSTFDLNGQIISIVVNDLQRNGRSARAVRGVMGG